MTKVIGFDPGTRIFGYGIIEWEGTRLKVIDFGCIRPPSKLPLADRYLIIHEAIEGLLKTHRPDACAFEKPFFKEINPQSTLKLGMAFASGLLAAKKMKIDVHEYTPTHAKKAVVGTGSASKEQVQGVLQRLFSLRTLPKPFDAADALALAVCCYYDVTRRKIQ